MATLEDPGKYPQTQLFLVTKLPILTSSILQHFIDYTRLSTRDAKNMLLHGFHPWIKCKITPPGRIGWTPATGDEIWLHKGFIDALESLVSDRGPEHFTFGPYDYYETREFIVSRLFLLLEVIVMHELVHFGRRTVYGYINDRDAEERLAKAFEKEAYGTIYTSTSLGLDGLLGDTL
jgi:hypothetical protein